MRPTQNSPVSLKSATPTHFEFGGARAEAFHLAILEADLIRVSLYPQGAPRLDRTWMIVDANGDMPREGRPRADLRPFGLPACKHQLAGESLHIQTDALHLRVDLGDFCIHWHDAQDRLFAADLPYGAYTYDRVGRAVFHRMQRRPQEHYYGFGERAGELDKYGRRMQMLNLDAIGYSARTGDPLYKHFPFYITFVPELKLAYGMLYDNLATTVFDMGQMIDGYRGNFRSYEAEDGDIEYYLILGDSIEGVLEKLARLTGFMILPPRWSLGYLGSTMLYTDMPDAQEQLKKFVDLCQEHDIPCDLFHLSSGYTTGENDGRRYVFNWNRKKVPDPSGMVDYFHAAGMRLSANIKPYFLTTHPRYAEIEQFGGFIQNTDSGAPEQVTLWSGGAFETAAGAYLDFTNPVAYEWWQAQVKTALLDYGIDSTWNDNNEYQIWDDDAVCAGFGQPTRVALLRPVQTLLMTLASYQMQLAQHPHLRPFVLCRSGCPGIQRYAQTWSGDNNTSWETLRYNIPMGLGMSLSGAPNTGHDVGGFYGEKPAPELFLRWIQNGIFHPRFTIHSYNTDGTVNEPWMYPEILPQVRAALQLRYRLIPYLYAYVVEAAQTGHPIIRPMVYEFAHDPRTHTESFDFMLGKWLLVASVLEAGARTRAVYLPAGEMFCDFYSGAWHAGGQSVTLDAPLERCPLLVRAGGVIPLGKTMRYIGAEPDDQRDLLIFPHPQNGQSSFTLIEDDGISRDGATTRINISLASTPSQIEVHISASGDYPLPYAELRVICPPGEERPLKISTDGRIQAVRG